MDERLGEAPRRDRVDWSDQVDSILGGDLCVAFGYLTPAGGAVVVPVTTLGARDRGAGTVTTSSSFGMWKKFTRIDHDPHVGLAYHAREHGSASGEAFVLAQGEASFPRQADASWLTPETLQAMSTMLLPMKTGKVWQWIGREYYFQRVPITVDVGRMTAWPDDTATEPSEVDGDPWPPGSPASQSPPGKGTGSRVRMSKVAKRLDRARHTLIGFKDSDGSVTIRPVTAGVDGDSLLLAGPGIPKGSRRAGLLAHWFEKHLNGQGSAVLTGWLECDDGTARYYPHTMAGYSVPASALVFSLASGLSAKAGYRKAVKLGLVVDGQWQGNPERGLSP